MKIYLVRHGESILNAQNAHQAGHVKLSDLGTEQARLIADRFRNIKIEKIIASSFERAKQTAEIIATKINKPIIFSETFVELKRPTEIEGKQYDEPDAKEIKEQINKNWHDPNFRYSDEETFFDFRDRSINALEYLEKLNSKNVLVITHGFVITMLVSSMLFGKKIKPHNFNSFRSIFKMNNTGVTICEYKDHQWKLISWNNFSHLE